MTTDSIKARRSRSAAVARQPLLNATFVDLATVAWSLSHRRCVRNNRGLVLAASPLTVIAITLRTANGPVGYKKVAIMIGWPRILALHEAVEFPLQFAT